MRTILFFISSCLFITACSASTTTPAPSDWVDPFFGTSEGTRHYAWMGGLNPAATTPFGLVQLGPDSVSEGDFGAGYIHEHTTLMGFSFMHMSGVGAFGDLGNFLVTPTTGPLKTSYGETGKPGTGYLSRKEGEVAKAGYYAVTLVDHGVRAELAAAPRAGILRFTFPEHKHARIQVDLARRIGGTAVMESVKVVGDNAIEGWMRCDYTGGGFRNGRGRCVNYTVHFRAEFTKPITDCGVWEAEITDGEKRKGAQPMKGFFDKMAAAKVTPGCREKEGKHIGFYTAFATTNKEQVLMKVGLSMNSVEGARRNLEHDIAGWDFEAVRATAEKAWNEELSRVGVEGGSADQRAIFYSSLYRAMVDPRTVSDADGAFVRGDKLRTVRTGAAYGRRTSFSGWDVYRSAFPLLTLVNPKAVGDTLQSLCDLADESQKGYLSRWDLFNAYCDCMVGNAAVTCIGDAYAKGLRNFDVAQAYRLAKSTCERVGVGEKGFRAGDLSVSLECSLPEWNMYRLAEAMGNAEDAARFKKRSEGWRGLYDSKTGWLNGACLECNPGQQGWHVPHDIQGLAELTGGREKLLARLEEFFEKTRDVASFHGNAYYTHVNEPSHLIPFLFNRLGAPWLTQKWVRHICDKAYKTGPMGLCGSDDVGQVSAWYVLAGMGLHQSCPGDTRYELFTPLFDKVTLRIDPLYGVSADGKPKVFTVVARGNGSGERYIQSARLNGQPLERCWVDHREIVAGGTLELELAPLPNKAWGLK